jgi:AhpD family alkylhydroperoxidase
MNGISAAMAAMAGRIDRLGKKPFKARDQMFLASRPVSGSSARRDEMVSDVLSGASEFFRRAVGIELEIVRRDHPDGVCRGRECTRMYNKENLTKLKKMDSLAPEVMKAFWAFDKAAIANGAIPVKYKELIAVAIALTTQCPYCIDIHSGNARKAGATDAEMVEAAMIAAALRAGAAVTHAMHALPN